MKRIIGLCTLLSVLLPALAFPQVPLGRLYKLYSPGCEGCGISESTFRGAYVKHITATGVVTLRAADGTESPIQLTTGSFTGTWNATDTYVLGNLVFHTNSFWIARGGGGSERSARSRPYDMGAAGI